MTGEEKIIRMANQIASFFASKPEEQGIQGLAEHINKFWERRMRSKFFEQMDKDATVFHDLVRKAAPSIKKPS